MQLIKKQLFLLLIVVAACSEKPVSVSDNADSVYEELAFDMPRVIEPVFPDLAVSILDFDAVGDGVTLNSEAFEAAINFVAEKGGGRVVIPRGIWLTGPITLKSNINLHIEEGAIVLFSTDKDLYPLVETSFEGLNTVRCISPIYGKDLENIAITGKGVFDGSGDAWRMVKRSKLTASQWNKFVKSGGVVSENGKNWYPSESFKVGTEESDMNVPTKRKTMEEFEEIRDFLRPVMVSLISCNKVLLEGPVFQNSPAWCLHPLMCENLTVRDVDVRNPWYSQNGDGIDIESCKNSIVIDCTFDVGDDAICIKSGKDRDGIDRAVPTENLIVKNCVVYHGHGGVTVGSEMSSGVKNMHVSGCTFIGTDVGLRFKSRRGRGGVVEGIYISDVMMINIPTNAISFNLYYGGLSVSEMMAQRSNDDKSVVEIPEVTDETPQFKDIYINNVTCKGALQGIYLQGLPEMNLENVNLSNINMTVKNGLFCMDAKGVNISNLKLETEIFPALNFFNSSDVSISALDLNESAEPSVYIEGEKTENIEILNVNQKNQAHFLKLGDDVDASTVKIGFSK